MTYRLLKIEHDDKNAVKLCSDKIYDIISNAGFKFSDIVIVCIGTDRSTGDSLGPFVGMYLKEQKIQVDVYGTIGNPVHALNLDEIRNKIIKNYENPFVIAIDACLGREESVGKIGIDNEPIRPGAGVNKDLGSIGNMSIHGIVNVSGFMEYFVLQNTRLDLVMKIAKVISESIEISINHYYRNMKVIQCWFEEA